MDMKKNQVIITALAILIVVAGYFSFTGKDVGIIDESEKSLPANVQGEELSGEEEVFSVDDAEVSAAVGDQIGETVFTQAQSTYGEVIVQVKLNREQSRAKSKELLMEIINNQDVDQEQKQVAIEELVDMSQRMELEAACEQQLMAKGFDECVVSLLEETVEVTIGTESLSDTEKAQIEEFITRKVNCPVSQLVIHTGGELQE